VGCGGGGVLSCGGLGGVGCCRVGSLLTFDIPQTALVATLNTYDFIPIGKKTKKIVAKSVH
jgi:hypothetical protein